MNAVLYFFWHGGPGFIGPVSECHRLAHLLNKWDSIDYDIKPLFDDGLTYGEHCMSLYLESDKSAWGEMEDLFVRTKKQGKTSKSNRRKETYFRKGMAAILNRHASRLLSVVEDAFRYSQFSLATSYLNYYFQEYDRGMDWVPLTHYCIDPERKKIIENAEILEKRCRGQRIPPKFAEVNCSEVKLHIAAREDIYLKFKWKKSQMAGAVMGLLEDRAWTSRDGTHFDSSHPIRKKLKKLFPRCSLSTMDTPTNLYGDTNDWFYIYFKWKPEHFNWREVQRAAKFTKKNIEPLFKGKFQPKSEVDGE